MGLHLWQADLKLSCSSFLALLDSQMDIYIGGLHDRNRALNGDLVAVKIKPQEEWKAECCLECVPCLGSVGNFSEGRSLVQILWDRIHLWEKKTGQSIHDVLLSNNSSIDSPVEEDEKLEEQPSDPLLEEDFVDGDELLESSAPLAASWDGSSPTPGALRPSDTIEVLGIERLLGQVPEQERHHRSSSPPLRGCVVAPDELSGEDDWSSDAESTGSAALEQHLEDMAFLQASLDARNNNHQQQDDSSAPQSRAGESVAERIERSLNLAASATTSEVSGSTEGRQSSALHLACSLRQRLR
ncbi:hypothetical protein HPB51_023476 [Rhipicephalus microplus]|uniref:Uncharacterized protein n=1 Tax=Rhipicephalus microplus TaxID=6941 RepID=A0A9J6F6D8_RHIMP|nr:hypothetical protein HPB51_023476 [Rhipicephalus microplus]